MLLEAFVVSVIQDGRRSCLCRPKCAASGLSTRCERSDFCVTRCQSIEIRTTQSRCCCRFLHGAHAARTDTRCLATKMNIVDPQMMDQYIVGHQAGNCRTLSTEKRELVGTSDVNWPPKNMNLTHIHYQQPRSSSVRLLFKI